MEDEDIYTDTGEDLAQCIDDAGDMELERHYDYERFMGRKPETPWSGGREWREMSRRMRRAIARVRR